MRKQVYTWLLSLRCFLFILLFVMPLMTWSSPAYPGLIEFYQPDGTTVKIRMMGDEFLSWAETEDGYTLLYDEVGFFTFAERTTEGNLVPSSIRALDKEYRSIDLNLKLESLEKHLRFSNIQVKEAQELRGKATSILRRSPKKIADNNGIENPVIGTRKNLVILVDFPDLPFSCTKHDFNDLMNKEHNPIYNPAVGSVKDYYREASFGQLDLQTTVVGVYRMSQPMAYYGGNSLRKDYHAQDMIREAVALADADIDFSEFDNDGDGVVDGMHIIYAGYGEEAGGGANCIWAHASSVNAYYDGVRLSPYSCSPELRNNSGKNMTHIGVICHELGHVFGTPDFYDTNYEINGTFPSTGQWDIMSQGNWNESGACPAMFNPYSVIYDFGWAEAKNIDKPSAITLKSKDKEQGFVRIDTQTEGEFYLLEYREHSGFDLRVPGHGLLVYHAIDNLSRRYSNTINAMYPQQFYIVSANAPAAVPNSNPESYGIVNTASCPFPGTLGKTELSDFTTPNMLSYRGLETEMPITNIEEHVTQKLISFDVAGGGYDGAYGIKVVDTGSDYISLSWKTTKENATMMLVASQDNTFGTPTKLSYSEGDVIENGGMVVYVGKDLEYTHTGLEGHTDYYYIVYTLVDDIWYASTIKRAKTETGIIRKFPYYENFESGVMEKAWKEEILEGESDSYWVNQEEYGGQIHFLRCSSRENIFSTRLVFPMMDFTGYDKAILSFDYTNGLTYSKLYYRISETDEWHFLKELDWHESPEKYYGDSHLNILLPDISPNYQVCVLSYMNRNNSGVSISTENLTIANFTVSVDTPSFVYTKEPTRIGSTFVDFPIDVISGMKDPTAWGVAISTDSINWTLVETLDRETCHITNLPLNTKYFYKAFVKVEGDIFYGQFNKECYFTTYPFTKGEGTELSPYIISTKEDWIEMRDAIHDQGSKCPLYGIYFRLENDLELTADCCLDWFTGYFDGNNHTISLKPKEGSINGDYIYGLFGNITTSVKDLTLILTHVQTQSRLSLLGNFNYGRISNCTVIFKTDDSSSYGLTFGIVRTNYHTGIIEDCKVIVKDESRVPYIHGIAQENWGVITDCTFSGKTSGSGIVYDNWGIIWNCINYGDLFHRKSQYSIESAAGITVSNESNGVVGNCCNYGSVDICCLPGIVEGNRGTIENCYNVGHSMIGDYNDHWGPTWARYPISGISRQNYGKENNCFYNGTVEEPFPYYNNSYAISYNPQGQITNCYYNGRFNDPWATQLSAYEFHTQEFVDTLNINAGYDYWTLTDDGIKLKMEVTDCKVNCIPYFKSELTSFRSDRAKIKATIAGSYLSEYGIEWQEEGTNRWDSMTTEKLLYTNVTIDDLKPFTMYYYRLYATDASGNKYYSKPQKFATLYKDIMLEQDTLFVSNKQDLLTFAQTLKQNYDYNNRVIKLINDIDLRGDKGEMWEPITGLFAGEFDGNGHQIKNMRIVKDSGNLGLFEKVGLCSIHDLYVTDAYLESTELLSNRRYPTIGGVLVSGSANGDKHTKLYNCCFTGTIKGGYTVGSIVGHFEDNHIENCYAKADIQINSHGESGFNVGRLIGQGSAKNCYFAGSCFKKKFGQSYKEIELQAENQAFYSDQGVENSYYMSDKTEGEKMTEDDMKNGFLLSLLPSELWASDDVNTPINNGFPIFKSQLHQPRISTQSVEFDEYDRPHLLAVYEQGANNPHTLFGFEWIQQADGTVGINEEKVDSKDYFDVPLENLKTGTYYYRAYAATSANDTIYGDWMSFEKKIPDAVPYIKKITSNLENGNATLGLGINLGDEIITDYYLAYWEQGSSDNPFKVSVKNIEEDVVLENLDSHTKYETILVAKGNSGKEYHSATASWLSPILGSDYVCGDANGDGHVSLADLTTTIGAYKGHTPSSYNRINADVDLDGNVNRNDAKMIKDWILKKLDNSVVPLSSKSNIEFGCDKIDMADSSRVVLDLYLDNNVTSFKVNVVIPEIPVKDVRIETADYDLSRDFAWYSRGDTLTIMSHSWENNNFISLKESPNVKIHIFVEESRLPYYADIDVSLVNCRIVDDECHESCLDDCTANLSVHDPYLIDGIYYGLSGENAIVKPLARGEYEGEVVIPATVSILGKERNVVSYDYNAFGDKVTSLTLPGTIVKVEYLSRCTNLEKITLLEGIQSIEKNALMGTKIKKLYIPASVSWVTGTVGNTPDRDDNLGTMLYLEAFEISPESKYYKAIDGVLYTKDGKQLVKCPFTKTGNFVVPEGVEKLGYFAFDQECDLEAVFLPSTLRIVGNWSLGKNPKIVSYAEIPMERYNSNSDRRWHYTIYVPSQFISSYKNQGEWQNVLPLIDTEINIVEGWNWSSFNSLSREVVDINSLTNTFSEAQSIFSQNGMIINDPVLGWVGNLGSFSNNTLKIKTLSDMSIKAMGIPYTLSENPILIYPGWNWLGYLLKNQQQIHEAFGEYNFTEGDILLGQDEIATYTDGAWQGEFMMKPGQGYIYYSGANSTKQLIYSEGNTEYSGNNSYGNESSNYWTYDPHAFANTTAIIACVSYITNPNIEVGAFVNGECRGVSKQAGSRILIAVHGEQNETIEFRVLDKMQGVIYQVNETVANNCASIGTYQEPFVLTIGDIVGYTHDADYIDGIVAKDKYSIYSISGIKVATSIKSDEFRKLPHGVYVINGKRIMR